MKGPTGGTASAVAGRWVNHRRQAEPTGKNGMNLPLIDVIWRVRGQLPLDAPMAAAEALARLDPLFQTPGTTYGINDDTLTYTKRNPAAQDRLATFTRGSLQIDQSAQGTVLRYDLSSTALLLCLLAPLLFLAFAQLAVAANAWEKSGAEASETARQDQDKPKAVGKLNPIDAFLGAPAPADLNKRNDKNQKDGRHSPKPGYVLAGLFFVIYLVGRWLEPWLIRRQFRAALSSALPVEQSYTKVR